MISKIRDLQSFNPEIGFSCAVDDPETGNLAGFIRHIKFKEQASWQTHKYEDFPHITAASKHLVEEYQKARSHSFAKPIKFDSISWFYQTFRSGTFNINNLSDTQVKLATLILDQRKYLAAPKVKYRYWQPLGSKFWHIKVWDENNVWLTPRFSKILAPNIAEAHKRVCQIGEIHTRVHHAAVEYLTYYYF